MDTKQTDNFKNKIHAHNISCMPLLPVPPQHQHLRALSQTLASRVVLFPVRWARRLWIRFCERLSSEHAFRTSRHALAKVWYGTQERWLRFK